MRRSVRGRAVVVGAAGGQVWLAGPAGADVTLRDRAGTEIATGTVDHFGDRLADLGVTRDQRGRGGLVLRGVSPGAYELVVGGRPSTPVHLRPDDELPEDYDERVRGQVLRPGFGYIETRDGTTLSANIALPDPQTWGPGPHATVVQYSAYADSRPDGLTGEPADDDVMNTEMNAALHLGFAVVGLNARGSGCSGGAFRMFERIHGLDGHDAIEAIAAQPWCLAVGMIGRSGPGFMQLLVAATQPPSLAAITPAAVLAQGFGTGRRPGGLVNTWVATRLAGWSVDPTDGVPDHAHPPRYSPGGWDDWVAAWLAATGDSVGEANQLLRGQTIPPLADVRSHREPDIEVLTAPRHWAPSVRCPTLLLGSWQDQESGPGWADLLEAFPADTEVCLAGVNGTHEETRMPEQTALWAGFLSSRLRGEPLRVTEAAERYLQAATEPLLGSHHLPIGPVPHVQPGRHVLLRLDNGAGPGGPGRPTAAGVLRADDWPPAAAALHTLWFGDDGHLGDVPSPVDGTLVYRYDPSIRPPTSGGRSDFDVNAPDAPYDWRVLPDGFGLLVAGPPAPHDQLLCGPASVDLWLAANVADLDLEVTLTELRADGWETYVQAGWLRASLRHLDQARSRPDHPVPTYLGADAEPLPAGVPTLVRVPVPAVAHRLHAGSRLGVRVEPPGGVQPLWTFDPLWPDGRDGDAHVEVEIGVGPATPSCLVVRVLDLDGVLPASPLPEPGALRRQPSRRWRPADVASAEQAADLVGHHRRAAVDAVVGLDVGPQPLADRSA